MMQIYDSFHLCFFFDSSNQKSNSFIFFPSQYNFGEDLETALLDSLEASLQTTTDTYCGRSSHLFTKRLKQSAVSVQQDAALRFFLMNLWMIKHSCGNYLLVIMVVNICPSYQQKNSPQLRKFALFQTIGGSIYYSLYTVIHYICRRDIMTQR